MKRNYAFLFIFFMCSLSHKPRNNSAFPGAEFARYTTTGGRGDVYHTNLNDSGSGLTAKDSKR